MTAIEESKDPNTFPLDELVGSLLTHEMKVKQGEESNKKALEKSNKVRVALKSTIQEKEKYDQDGSHEDEDMAIFTRKFNKYMRMKKYGNARKPQRREIIKGESSKRENDPIVCYESKKPGHIKFDCPLLNKQSKRPSKKAMVATWSDSDAFDDDSYNDEVANLCLIAVDDSKITFTSCDSNA